MKKSGLISLFYRLGLFNMGHSLRPNRLTVLAYHRVIDLHAPGFDTFKPNVSATPAAFAAQMDFVHRHFNVVSAGQVVAWLHGQQSLPRHPLLITFDDGYRDNLAYALPILQQYCMPAVIFLATDYIGNSSPFFWDLVAYCFCHTSCSEAELPQIGRQSWSDEASRDGVVRTWVNALKVLPDDVKWQLVKQLPEILGITVPANAFAGLHLSWDEVRQLVAAGVDMGGHTQSHPILTRVSLDQAHNEIAGCKAHIEAEIGRPITTFAYPNGLSNDFNPAIQALLTQAGYTAAFTLLPGPAYPAEIRREPLAIRRVFIHHKDTLERFAAKVIGLPRLLGLP